MVVEVNSRKYRTHVVSEGGKNPVWNKVFFIPVESMGDQVIITCFDEDKLSNDLVGTVQIPMYTMCRNGGVKDWFDIIYKNKTSGRIYIESNYKPPGEAVKKDGASSLFSNFQNKFKNNLFAKLG